MRQERIVRPRRPRRRCDEPRDRTAAVARVTIDHPEDTDEVLRRIDAALSDPHHVDGP